MEHPEREEYGRVNGARNAGRANTRQRRKKHAEGASGPYSTFARPVFLQVVPFTLSDHQLWRVVLGVVLPFLSNELLLSLLV